MPNIVDTILAKQVVNQMETAGFILTERWHKPYSFYENHNHKLTSLGILYKGSFTEIISKKPQDCLPYSLQMLPAGECHSYRFNKSEVQCLTIEIQSQRLQEISRFTQGLTQSIYFHKGLSLPIKRLYQEFSSKDYTSNLILEGIIYEILGNVEKFSSKFSVPVEPIWLRRARDFIHENARQGVSLTDVATLVEVHPSYLARTFRKYYHCSISDYIKKERLNYAVEQICKTNKPFSQIALEAGFYDQSHFASAFKAYMKITPREFRRQF